MSFLQLRAPFNRGKSLPTVDTYAATNILGSSADGNGWLVSDGGYPVTELGFCWSTLENPTTADSTVTVTVAGGAYSTTMSPLTASTLYHYRAYAINAIGTSYGQDYTFTTDVAATSNIMNMCLMGVG